MSIYCHSNFRWLPSAQYLPTTVVQYKQNLKHWCSGKENVSFFFSLSPFSSCFHDGCHACNMMLFGSRPHPITHHCFALCWKDWRLIYSHRWQNEKFLLPVYTAYWNCSLHAWIEVYVVSAETYIYQYNREREREKGHHMNFCLLLAIYLLFSLVNSLSYAFVRYLSIALKKLEFCLVKMQCWIFIDCVLLHFFSAYLLSLKNTWINSIKINSGRHFWSLPSSFQICVNSTVVDYAFHYLFSPFFQCFSWFFEQVVMEDLGISFRSIIIYQTIVLIHQVHLQFNFPQFLHNI